MNKTMMKLVIGTEGMFFICLIMSFVYMAFTAGFEPHQLHALDIEKTGIFTTVLIASSFTFWFADKKYKEGNIKKLKLWLIITLVLGILFLIGQGREYWRLINDHVTLGSGVFGTSFYTLTGFHGFHVFAGLIILSIVLAFTFLGDFNKPGSTVISTVGYYWHFIDVVWIVVFTVVYVLPHFTNI
jgi:heme/copper-type cytochrome/quinol oxidase subunit 3